MGDSVILVLVYVDDMVVAVKDNAKVAWFKRELGKIFELTDLGELGLILSIQVKCNCQACTIQLNQMAYIQELLVRHGMQGCTPMSTPLVSKECLTTTQSPTSPTDKAVYLEYAKGMKNLEVLGGVLYSTQTRPDIQHAISICAQFSANPGKLHLEAFSITLWEQLI